MQEIRRVRLFLSGKSSPWFDLKPNEILIRKGSKDLQSNLSKYPKYCILAVAADIAKLGTKICKTASIIIVSLNKSYNPYLSKIDITLLIVTWRANFPIHHFTKLNFFQKKRQKNTLQPFDWVSFSFAKSPILITFFLDHFDIS